jgi:uncharacterized membrane protein HdeD (DUF308 family)
MTESTYGAEGNEGTGGWWALLLIGVLGIVAGAIILSKPSESLATLAVIAGIFLLLDGILELVDSFLRGGTANRGLIALIGVLSAIVGVLLIRHPVGGITAVALLIGIWMIAVGVIRFATAFEDGENRGWHAFAGIVELIVGIVIVANPDIGYTTLAILVGIGFIFNGFGMAALGWGMHRARKAA